MSFLQIDGFRVEVVRKPIKSLRLTVYAADGRVRVAAPPRVPLAAIEEFVLARRPWIERHQTRFAAREPLPVPAYEPGETHYYQGRPYTLCVHENAGRAWVQLREDGSFLDLYIPSGSTPAQRAQVLQA